MSDFDLRVAMLAAKYSDDWEVLYDIWCRYDDGNHRDVDFAALEAAWRRNFIRYGINQRQFVLYQEYLYGTKRE